MSRAKKLINADWQFSIGNKITRESEMVSLPHAVTLTPANSSGGRNYQGEYCYGKNIFLGKDYLHKKVFLYFEGGMGVSKLFVNDHLVCEHFCGYTPITADITAHIEIEKENKIFILLDNSDNGDIPPGKAQKDLDFSYEGGLYRNCWIYATNKTYITNPLIEDEIAGGGVFVHYLNVSNDFAQIGIKTHIANEDANDKNILVQYDLIEENKTIITKSVDISIKASEKVCIEDILDVNSPKLWSPDEANVYTLKISLIENSLVLDDCLTEIGIRTFTYTNDDGILINGKSYRLNGSNYHQTYPYIGNGVPDCLLIRDAKKLAELGTQNIRSHYPFGDTFTSQCSKLGMTLIVSTPGWQWFKEGRFVEIYYKNLREIIRWQRNIPAIILWEPFPNESQIPEYFQKRLIEIVKEEYPYADCYTASDHGDTDVSYREYDPGMLEPGMEGYIPYARSGEQTKPIWIREYGDAPDNWTDHNCAWRVKRGFGDYAMVRSVDRMLGLDPQLEDGGYISAYNKKNICGYGVWPAIEHNRGYHINPCYGGYLDLFRIPKFTAEFIKSQLSPQKNIALFIANWWTEFSPSDVAVYSNAEKVRLYYDNVLIEERSPENMPIAHPPFVFQNVRQKYKKRDRATLTAEALIDGKIVKTVSVTSPGVPKKLKLRADAMDIPFHANNSDIVLVYCDILDAQNNLVPLMGDNHPIKFTIEGSATIVGDTSIGANPICAEAGIATILVKSTNIAGKVTIKAKMLWKQSEAIAIEDDILILETI